MALTSGQKLGPYEIIAPLGAGGMGEVYRAKDTRLDRQVAIKILAEDLDQDAEALNRFQRESRALAALAHPNIMAIYDVGTDRDVSFLVTEFLEGETLRERIGVGPLPWRKAVDVAIGIADGLAAAHARGIIHRDLKPANIFLTADGVVKILDFGLAKVHPHRSQSSQQPGDEVTRTAQTMPGVFLGTAPYMSPEQARSLPADARSDIFSFGAVLYEMVTGRRAFGDGTVADTMTAVLRHNPPDPGQFVRDLPAELIRVIARCLEKKEGERFGSAHDLAFTLRTLSTNGVRLATGGGPRTRTMLGVQLAVGVVAVAALLLTLNVGGWRERLFSHPQVGRISSLAVLPMENVSRDPDEEYFVDGMTEALISDLAKIGGLKVISRTSVMGFKGTTKRLPDIARELNVDAVVEGSVLRVGERVRITAQLIHAATEENLWAETYDRDLRDVLRLHSELARTITQEIKVTLTPQEQARLADARPVNPAAHEAYLKGRFHWHNRARTGMQKAIEHYRRAIELDPHYAPAYAGIADTYTHLARHGHLSPKEAFALAKQAALKAVELDDSLAEAHGALAVIALYFDWDWIVAERELRRALNLNVSYEEAHHQYSHLLLTVGRPDDSLTASRRALELDPLDLLLNVHLGWHYTMTRQYDQGIAQLKSVLEMDPNLYQALRHIGWVYMYDSLHAEAITALETATKLEPDSAQAMAALAAAYAAGGQSSDARALLQQLEGSLPQRYVSACDIAAVYAALNEVEAAFAWLDIACEERSPRMMELGLDPVFDPLRTDPRFADLIRRVGLPPSQ